MVLSNAERQQRFRERKRAAEDTDAFTTFARTAFAHARHIYDPLRSALEIARRDFVGDRAVELLVRAASAPAMTTTTGWADTFARVENVFLPSLVGPSAGADVLNRGMQVRFDGAGTISLPTISIGSATFVGQGKPIPVAQFTTAAGVQLVPHGLKLIAVLTREMVESSNAEQTIRTTLIESASYGLDAALFGTSAGTADAPPGLLNGVTAKTPSTATILSDALLEDLSALGGAVARVAGDDIVYIAAPEQALAINLYAPNFDMPVLASRALAAKTVIALAVPALASGFDPVPVIEASKHSELMMDTVPAEIAPSGGTMTAPTITIFQGDKIALKMRMQAGWALRAANAIAFMNNVAW